MIGTRLSAYEIEAELGSGGMGSVYLARCAEDAAGLEAGTPVALKVIHPNLLDQPGFFKRFLREAQLGQAVQHENVVQTYDCDATLHEGAQQNFLVMEYVEGMTLRDLLLELERVPEELCRHIGREVAKGLAAVHAAGAIHRDIKPENVLITKEHVVKVMDLGVARLQDEAVRLSKAGAFVGSLEYAAPEQFRTADGGPDGRADLHALGVLLYELATAHHPYRADDISSILRNILHEEPRKAGEVHPQLSPFYEEVVHTLMAKDREARFASASDLVVILEAGEDGPWWASRRQVLRQETKQPLRRMRIPRETALYGREDDLASLQGLFERAKAGQGQVVVVEGEAGIGKTRLIDEFVAGLRSRGEGIHFLFGTHAPGGAGPAVGAFSEAFGEQFGPDGAGPWLEKTPLLVPAFDAFLRGEPTPQGAEPLTQESLGTAFMHATRSLAADRPTVVLIDDLHFASDAARGLFMTLALAVRDHPIFLIGTQRPAADGTWLANLTRLEYGSALSVHRLGAKHLVELLEDSFGSQQLAEELSARIAVKSDGNPFFAFEIIRGLREGRYITQKDDGTWARTQVIEEIQIPSSVSDLIQARLAGLQEDEKAFLEVAACCGFAFDPLLVASVQGVAQIPAMRMLARIEREHRLVRSKGRRFVFDHHQIQETLYGDMPVLLREPYHAAIAEALEEREGVATGDVEDVGGALCVELCRQFLAGARGERAVRYIERALEHLEHSYRNEEAVVLADQALASEKDVTGALRARVLLKKNDRLHMMSRFDAQESVLDEAREHARSANDVAGRGRVAVARGRLYYITGRFDEAQETFTHALGLSKESEDPGGIALALEGQGLVLRRIGRFDEAGAAFEGAIEACQLADDPRLEARTWVNLGTVHRYEGNFDQAQATYERALARAHDAGDRVAEALATGNLGLVHSARGRYDEARACQERSLRIFREIGYRGGEGAAITAVGTVLQEQGYLEEARARFEEYLGLCREMGNARAMVIPLLMMASVLIDLGQLEQARKTALQTLDLLGGASAPYEESEAHVLLARVADEEGAGDEGLRHVEQSLALRRGSGQMAGVADALVLLAGLQHRAGRFDAAKEALEEVLPMLVAQGRLREVAYAHALTACLPGGDADAALGAIEEAGAPTEDPSILWLLHEAGAEGDHLARAKALLDEALAKVPEASRGPMQSRVRLHREILAAWMAKGPT